MQGSWGDFWLQALDDHRLHHHYRHQHDHQFGVGHSAATHSDANGSVARFCHSGYWTRHGSLALQRGENDQSQIQPNGRSRTWIPLQVYRQRIMDSLLHQSYVFTISFFFFPAKLSAFFTTSYKKNILNYLTLIKDYVFMFIFYFLFHAAGETDRHCIYINYFPTEEYSPDPNDSTLTIPCKTHKNLFFCCFLIQIRSFKKLPIRICIF